MPQRLDIAAFLVLADLFARTLLAPTELPVGAITAIVGGPAFLWLLRRETAALRREPGRPAAP